MMTTAESGSSRAEVEFELHSNLIVLRGEVNGVAQSLLLDTGASQTVLNGASAARLGVEPGDDCGQAMGAGGRVAASLTRVGSLAIGGARVEDLPVAILDISALCEQIGSSIDGILGYNFLSNFKVTIDYRIHRVLLVHQGDRSTS